MLALDDPGHIRTLLETQSTEQNGAVSPDGNWLAYESNETGDFEIYVRPFPGVNGGRWKISKTGGSQPVWRRDSKELFYWDKSGALTGVAIHAGPELRAEIPTKLLEPRYFRGNVAAGPTYDVSLDGRRFLVIKPVGNPMDNPTPMSIVVQQNWFEELKKLTAEHR
jgi:serine/threonine-protein kinase